MTRVREDKEREAGDGFDGTWVAHPDLVPVATRDLRRRPRRPPEPEGAPARRGRGARRATLLDLRVAGGAITEAGVRNERLGRRSSTSTPGWAGNGAAAINNLMEDAATAEISRAQLWQWRVTGTTLDDGAAFDGDAATARSATRSSRSSARRAYGHLAQAAELLDGLVLDDEFRRVPDAARVRAAAVAPRRTPGGGTRGASAASDLLGPSRRIWPSIRTPGKCPSATCRRQRPRCRRRHARPRRSADRGFATPAAGLTWPMTFAAWPPSPPTWAPRQPPQR